MLNLMASPRRAAFCRTLREGMSVLAVSRGAVRHCAHLSLGLLALCATVTTAQADDFYKGKRMSMMVGAGPGASFDIYARLVADNIGKYIEGKPVFIVENRPGAGSRLAMNHVYNVAAQDGSVVGMMVNTLALDEFIHPERSQQMDLAKFKWIGSAASLSSAIVVWHTSPVKSIEDAKKISIPLGSVSRTSESFMMPSIINEMLGTKFKLVGGYVTFTEITLAVQRGEVNGQGGGWGGVLAATPQFVESKELIPIVQVGVKKDPTIPGDVPLLSDLAQTDDQKAVLGLLTKATAFSRPFMMGPKVPDERVAIVRKGFADMTSDPAFVSYAASKNIEISPIMGEEITKALVELQRDFKPEYAARLRAALD